MRWFSRARWNGSFLSEDENGTEFVRAAVDRELRHRRRKARTRKTEAAKPAL